MVSARVSLYDCEAHVDVFGSRPIEPRGTCGAMDAGCSVSFPNSLDALPNPLSAAAPRIEPGRGSSVMGVS